MQLLIPLLLAVVLMWWVYSKFTPEQLQTIKLHFKNADYGYVLLSVLFGFLSHISRAWRWNYMLNPMGYTPKFHNNVMAIGVSYILNLLIPRSGELSRAAVMKKYENIPFEKGFGTIFAERAVDLIILFTMAFLAFVLQYNTLKTFVFTHINLYGFIIILGILVLAFLALTLYVRRSTSVLSIKIKTFIGGFRDGIFSILKMKKKGLFIAHTIFMWLMYLAMFYATAFALEETSSISFSVALTGFVVGGFVIAFTNGGFGYYPIFIAKLLVLFNIPEATGTAFGWIAWTAQFAMIIVFGSISFALLPVLNRKKTVRDGES